MAEDSALTRFANSEIHQNVAETNSRRQPPRRRRQARRRRLDRPDRRRGPAPPRRRTPPPSRGSSRSSRTGAACPGRPRRRASPRATAGRPPAPARNSAPRRVRAVIAAADAAGVTAYGSFATGTEIDRRRQLEGRPRRPATRTTSPSSSRSRWARAAEPATPRRPRSTPPRSMPPRSAGRPRSRRARRPTRSPSSRATTRSSSRSTPSSTSSTCSATSGSRALAVQEERSFVEPGKRIGSDLVTIRDDGRDPAGLPLWFDYEGVAKQRVDLVERGRLPRRRPRRPDGGARRRRLDRPWPARPEPVRSVPAEHGHGRRRRPRATT